MISIKTDRGSDVITSGSQSSSSLFMNVKLNAKIGKFNSLLSNSVECLRKVKQ